MRKKIVTGTAASFSAARPAILSVAATRGHTSRVVLYAASSMISVWGFGLRPLVSALAARCRSGAVGEMWELRPYAIGAEGPFATLSNLDSAAAERVLFVPCLDVHPAAKTCERRTRI